jgi:mersacidin/lichenicidin family type 2 lantibiotic
MANIDIARALKDKSYFNSLTEEEKRMVRQANPAGESDLSDSDLDTVSGGLGGGEGLEATTTSTQVACSCPANPAGETSQAVAPDNPGGCACSC